MSRSLAGVCLPAAVTPSMSGSWPAATWIPTPVRNPTSTVRERKFARNPSLASRASSSIAPASRAASPASRTYRCDPATARPVSAAASMTAVAESAATTRWRDEPRTANTAIGSSIVYRPVTTGIPAIFAYPRTSGMPRAASVMPASTSAGTWDRSMGSSPRIAGSARSHPRWRPPRESGNLSPPPVSLRFRVRSSSRRQPFRAVTAASGFCAPPASMTVGPWRPTPSKELRELLRNDYRKRPRRAARVRGIAEAAGSGFKSVDR